MAIIGGGYIAVEFAGIFNNYGTEVHLVYRQASSFRRRTHPFSADCHCHR